MNRFDELYKYIDENYNIVEVTDENNLGTRYIDFMVNNNKYTASYNKKSNSFCVTDADCNEFIYKGFSFVALKLALEQEEDKTKVVA